jgi:hypothetical protein
MFQSQVENRSSPESHKESGHPEIEEDPYSHRYLIAVSRKSVIRQ